MQLGLSSYTYPWAVGVEDRQLGGPLTAVQLLDRAADLGVPVVQFADNLPLDRLDAAELDSLRAAALAAGIRIEVGTRGIGPQLARYAELAECFEASFVRIVVDSPDDEPSLADARARLAEYEAEFRQRDLTLAIENHDRFTTTELVSLVEGLGSWVGICLDTVNSFGALESPAAVIRSLIPFAVNIHLKDFTIRRHPHQLGFEVIGAPAGGGLLDIPFLLEQASTHGNAESVILELWTPPGRTLAETIAREFDWVSQSIAFLREHTRLEFGPTPAAPKASPAGQWGGQ